jgi:7,8-dihydro-6-hydroxymethylpterin-pyrophosphokinase
MGRTDKGQKKARTIDMDILLFGDEIIDSERLTIPHKELTNRPFALIPLVQISPKIIHPVSKKPLSEYLTKDDYNKLILYKDHVARNI